MVKKIYWLIIILVIVLLGFLGYKWFKSTNQYLPTSLSEIKCIESVMVQGQAMEPAIKSGTYLLLNKCLEDKDNLVSGTVVLVRQNGTSRLGRIKDKLNRAEGVYYTIGQDNRPGQEFTVSANDIIAVQK